jgi:hypothetical protein
MNRQSGARDNTFLYVDASSSIFNQHLRLIPLHQSYLILGQRKLLWWPWSLSELERYDIFCYSIMVGVECKANNVFRGREELMAEVRKAYLKLILIWVSFSSLFWGQCHAVCNVKSERCILSYEKKVRNVIICRMSFRISVPYPWVLLLYWISLILRVGIV